jgi:GTPase SAR1 family protein
MRQISDKQPEDVPKIIVGNKCDSTQREVSFEEGRTLAERYNLPFLETSALQNINIEEVFLTVGRKIKEKLERDEI